MVLAPLALEAVRLLQQAEHVQEDVEGGCDHFETLKVDGVLRKKIQGVEVLVKFVKLFGVTFFQDTNVFEKQQVFGVALKILSVEGENRYRGFLIDMVGISWFSPVVKVELLRTRIEGEVQFWFTLVVLRRLLLLAFHSECVAPDITEAFCRGRLLRNLVVKVLKLLGYVKI